MDTLWVYGTLLSDIGSRQGKWLAEHASLQELGWASGDLYDLGQYPAFVYRKDCDRRIHGEIWKLSQAREVWDVLDPYEGYDPALPPEHNLYQREWLPVQTQKGEIQCWTYTYHGTLSGLPLIRENDYYSFWRKNIAHQTFTGHAS